MKSKTGATTPKAVLGLLSICPMSGYDIRQLAQWFIGHFWTESYGQIYPALRQLDEDGLAEKKTERHKGKPDRHIYSLTEKGREDLRTWLRVPPEDEVPRNALLLKLFFGGQVEAGASALHVSEAMEREKIRLEVYRQTEKKLLKESKRNPQLPFWLMTLNFGRHRSKATVKWCEQTLKELKRVEMERAGTKRKRKSKEAPHA